MLLFSLILLVTRESSGLEFPTSQCISTMPSLPIQLTSCFGSRSGPALLSFPVLSSLFHCRSCEGPAWPSSRRSPWVRRAWTRWWTWWGRSSGLTTASSGMSAPSQTPTTWPTPGPAWASTRTCRTTPTPPGSSSSTASARPRRREERMCSRTVSLRLRKSEPTFRLSLNYWGFPQETARIFLSIDILGVISFSQTTNS